MSGRASCPVSDAPCGADSASLLAGWFERPDVTPVSDAAMGAAYESVGMRERSRLKLTLSRLHAFWGDQRGKNVQVREFPQGFSSRVEDSPAALALFFCDPAFPHAERLLAALMPAMLAGAECLVCFPSEPAAGVSAALLAAMELAGVEQGCAATHAAVRDLLCDLRNIGPRVVAFDPLAPGMERTFLRALRLGFPCRVLRDNASLTLDAAHEGLWCWPELEPGWFRCRRLHFQRADAGTGVLEA